MDSTNLNQNTKLHRGSSVEVQFYNLTTNYLPYYTIDN